MRADTRLEDAFGILHETRQNDPPVADAERRVVGESNAWQVLDVASRVFTDGESALARSRPEDAPGA